MPNTTLTPAAVIAILAETPARLAALTDELTLAQLRTFPAPVPAAAASTEAWSATDVLAHLRACADVWGGCISAILASDHPTLRAINPTTWIERTTYRDLDFAPSLHAFTAQRGALLTVLEPLPPADWLRAATVSGAGRPRERSVLFYAQWMARHERTHDKQLARIAAAVRTA